MVATVIMIAAISKNGVIGVDNTLPWSYPADLKLFKEFTLGHSILMGRNTWESLPAKSRPLPGRQNWVLSRDATYRANLRKSGQNVLCASGLGIINSVAPQKGAWYVIGGSGLYTEAMPYADTLEITIIPEKIHPAGAVFFPEIKESDWKLVHACTHPYDTKLRCARYERRPGTKALPSHLSV